MKKIMSILLAIVLLFTITPSSEASSQVFKDVPKSHPNYSAIMYLLEKGVIEPNERFGLNDKVTREEVAVMVAKATGLDGTKTKTKFKDVPESRYSSGYINSAVKAGVLNGFPDGTFKPTQQVTRGHMAAFIANGFKLTKEANVSFRDVPKGATSYNAVRKLVAANITSGYPDGTFKPNDTLTRAHIAAFIARAMEPSFRPKETNVSNKPAPKPTKTKPTTSKPTVANGYGNVKGSVTWQYNKYIGTKPDVGAGVFLFPTNFKYSGEPDFPLYSTLGSIPKNTNLHYAKVNGFGTYEISDVPTGDYYIVISSNNTTRNILDESELLIASVLKPMLGSQYDDFEMLNLIVDKHTWKKITVKKDKTVDVSHDFGYTYF